MVETLITKKVREAHGQKSDTNLCPDGGIEAIAGVVYDLLAKKGMVPSAKSVGRPASPDRLKLSALTWHEDGATSAEVGAAIKCLEHKRPLNDFQQMISETESLEALERKGRRYINGGKRIAEEIQALLRKEGIEEYEYKMLLSSKGKRRRFIFSFKHFLRLWMEREEQLEYNAKD